MRPKLARLACRYRAWIISRPGYLAARDDWALDVAMRFGQGRPQGPEITLVRWPHKTLIHRAGQREMSALSPPLRHAINRSYLRALIRNLGWALGPLAYGLEVTIILPRPSHHQILTQMSRQGAEHPYRLDS